MRTYKYCGVRILSQAISFVLIVMNVAGLGYIHFNKTIYGTEYMAENKPPISFRTAGQCIVFINILFAIAGNSVITSDIKIWMKLFSRLTRLHILFTIASVVYFGLFYRSAVAIAFSETMSSTQLFPSPMPGYGTAGHATALNVFQKELDIVLGVFGLLQIGTAVLMYALTRIFKYATTIKLETKPKTGNVVVTKASNVGCPVDTLGSKSIIPTNTIKVR